MQYDSRYYSRVAANDATKTLKLKGFKMGKLSFNQIAELLIKQCSDETLAGILNGFLSCEDDELSQNEINWGCAVFDSLSERVSAHVMSLATGSQEDE